MKELTLSAYAKINLHLEVVGRLENGYHAIESLLHSVSLCDHVTLRRRESGIALVCDDPTLDCGEGNLISRAAAAFYRESGIEPGIRIDLVKRIPTRAGMGGGSADGAATLRGLNLLYGRVLSEDRLYRIAASLGADLPFCLRARPSLARGIGDTLSDAPSLPPCHLVIAMGNDEKRSTAHAYGALDALSFTPRSIAPLWSAMESGSTERICASLFNRFEAVNPTARGGMGRLSALGAEGTLLCGSGTAFFGIFRADRALAAEEAAQAMREEGYRAWIASPIG